MNPIRECWWWRFFLMMRRCSLHVTFEVLVSCCTGIAHTSQNRSFEYRSLRNLQILQLFIPFIPSFVSFLHFYSCCWLFFIVKKAGFGSNEISVWNKEAMGKVRCWIERDNCCTKLCCEILRVYGWSSWFLSMFTNKAQKEIGKGKKVSWSGLPLIS